MDKQTLKDKFKEYDAVLDTYNEALANERDAAKEIAAVGGRVYKRTDRAGIFKVAFSDANGRANIGTTSEIPEEPLHEELYGRFKRCWDSVYDLQKDFMDLENELEDLILETANEACSYDPLKHPLPRSFAFWDGERKRVYVLDHDGTRWSSVIAHTDETQLFVSLEGQ